MLDHIFHNYPGWTEERIRRLSLRRIYRMYNNIPYVNPMYSPPESNGKTTPPQANNPDPTAGMTDAQRKLFERYGTVTRQ